MLQNNEIWKIGTNLKKYIDLYNECNFLNLDDIFTFEKNFKSVNINVKNEIFNFKENKGVEESTLEQAIRIWLFLGLIERIDYKLEDSYSRKWLEYKYKVLIKPGQKEFSKKIIDWLHCLFLNIDKYKNNKELIIFLNSLSAAVVLENTIIKQQKNEDYDYELLNSIIKRFKKNQIQNLLCEYEISKDLKKFLNYYKFDNLLNSFKIIIVSFKYVFGSDYNNYITLNDSFWVYCGDSDINNTPIESEPIYSEEFTDKSGISTSIVSFSDFMLMYFYPFVGPKIKIPIYQRNYVWDSDLVEYFLNDINVIKFNEYHFIGNMVLKESDNNSKDMKLIDGQQRLTTCLIILRALYNIFVIKGFKLPKNIIDIFKLDDKGENKLTKKFEKIDVETELSTLIKILKGKKVDDANKNVLKNSITVFDFLDKFNESELNDFLKKFLSGIVFSLTIDKVSNEFKLFEDLNTKSIDLNIMDLTKNYLLSRIDDCLIANNENKIIEYYNKYIDNKFKSYKDYLIIIKDFVKAMLRMHGYENNGIKEFVLFKELINNEFIKEINLNNIDEVINLFDSIGKFIDLFLSITKEEIFTYKNSDYFHLQDILIMLKNRSVYTPLIMKIITETKFNENLKSSENLLKVRELLFEIEKFEVKLQISNYRGQSLTSFIDNQIQKNLNFINIEASQLRTLFDKSVFFVPLDTFRNDIINKNISPKMQTLLCYRIEYWFMNGKKIFNDDYNVKYPSFDKMSIEHIMPKSMNYEWLNYLCKQENNDIDAVRKKYKNNLNKIGNLLLIELKSNSKIKDKLFNEKVEHYNKETKIKDSYMYKGSEEDELNLMSLNKLENFNFETLEKRSEQISKVAEIIWN